MGPYDAGNDLIEYTVSVMQYSSNQKINADCNSIQIINYSTLPMFVNDSVKLVPVSTGGGVGFANRFGPWCLEIKGNRYEVDRSQYDLKFDPTDITGGTAKCVVIRKIYKYPEKEGKALRKTN